MTREAGIGKLACFVLFWVSGTVLLATTALTGNGVIILTSQGVQTAKRPTREVEPSPSGESACQQFRNLLNAFDQSLPLALAAYNAGSQRAVNAGYQVPLIKEP